MMKKLENPAVGLLIIRVFVGIAFILHGYSKLSGIDGTVGFFGSLGLPAIVAYLVTIAELLGGITLVLGFYTRITGIVLAVVMLGALVFAHAKNGGGELASIMLAANLGLAFLGAGAYSLDSRQARM